MRARGERTGAMGWGAGKTLSVSNWKPLGSSSIANIPQVSIFHARARGKQLEVGMANGWTSERRARQAALIRNWKLWLQATEPRTVNSKATALRNVYRNGNSLVRTGAEARSAVRSETCQLMCQYAALSRRLRWAGWPGTASAAGLARVDVTTVASTWGLG